MIDSSEVYSEGLPETVVEQEHNHVVFGRDGEPVRVISKDEFIGRLMEASGRTRKDVKKLIFTDRIRMEAIRDIWGEDIDAWYMPPEEKKIERFYTSFKDRYACTTILPFEQECGWIVEENIVVDEDDRCGQTELCIQPEDGGEPSCWPIHSVEIRERGGEGGWRDADDERYLIASIPAQRGVCRTDKHKCRYADHIRTGERGTYIKGEL